MVCKVEVVVPDMEGAFATNAVAVAFVIISGEEEPIALFVVIDILYVFVVIRVE